MRQLEDKGRLKIIDSLESSPAVFASVLDRLKNGEELGIIMETLSIRGLMNKDFSDTSKNTCDSDKNSN